MIDCKIEQASDSCVLTITGRLTGESAVKLKEKLIKAFDAEHIVFNFEKVTAVDGSCLEILNSAYRTLKYLNKHLVVLGIRPEVLKKAYGAGAVPTAFGTFPPL